MTVIYTDMPQELNTDDLVITLQWVSYLHVATLTHTTPKNAV